MPKTVLKLVVAEDGLKSTLKIIEEKARTGSIGDGRIFDVLWKRQITSALGREGCENASFLQSANNRVQ